MDNKNYEFLKQIASGINPITGEKFPPNDILLNTEVSARLFRLAFELETEEQALKDKFQYTEDINVNIKVSESSTLGSFCSDISKGIKQKEKIEIFSKSTIESKISAFLSEKGIFQIVRNSNNRKKCTVTVEGEKYGFYNIIEPEKQEVDRTKVYCSDQAQKYIISNLTEILK